MIKFKPALNFIIIVLIMTSCSALRVTTRDAVPVTTVNAEEERTKTFYKIVGTEKSWDEDLCNGGALAEVTVVNNLFHSFVNVVTLGIVSPVTVKYKCNETCD